MSGTSARFGTRPFLGLVAALGLLAAITMPALGASVTPIFVDITANRECDDFQGAGQSWTTLKVDPNPNGAGPFVYTDGTLTVTITNATNDKSFSWSSNVGVDAVYVKAGSGGSNLYVYDPPAESTGDTSLQSPGEQGNGISHISFCYDAGGSTPPPPPPPQGGGGGQLGGNPTPTPVVGSLPNTAVEGGAVPAAPPLGVGLGLLLIGSVAAMAHRRVARER